MISGDHQLDEPKQFFGGIIADPMGLGKTLTMIALVAATVREHHHAGSFGSLDSSEANNPTLIVVPPPCMFSIVPIRIQEPFLMTVLVLDTWEEQLSQ